MTKSLGIIQLARALYRYYFDSACF